MRKATRNEIDITTVTADGHAIPRDASSSAPVRGRKRPAKEIEDGIVQALEKRKPIIACIAVGARGNLPSVLKNYEWPMLCNHRASAHQGVILATFQIKLAKTPRCRLGRHNVIKPHSLNLNSLSLYRHRQKRKIQFSKSAATRVSFYTDKLAHASLIG